MLRQYKASRFRGGHNPHQIGTIDAGTVVYIQDGTRPFGRSTFAPIIRRDPWIIEAWQPRECMGAAMAGGHLAHVRSLRTGRRTTVADWIIRWALDHDCER